MSRIKKSSGFIFWQQALNPSFERYKQQSKSDDDVPKPARTESVKEVLRPAIDNAKELNRREKNRKVSDKLRKKTNKKHMEDNGTETKVLRMTVGIGEGDLTVKAKQASEWLHEGHRVKIELKLKGRANAIEADFLKERLQRVLILLTENYKTAEPIKKIPNGMTMVIEKAKGKIGESILDANGLVM